MKKLESLDQFRSWAKENAFVYPSSEIYGGFAAVYDYGHYGILLKNNIQREWEKTMVQDRDDVVLLDSGIFMHPKTWVASGHATGFDDVLVEDKKTHTRYRADHLLEDEIKKLQEVIENYFKKPYKEVTLDDLEKKYFIEDRVLKGVHGGSMHAVIAELVLGHKSLDKATADELQDIIDALGIGENLTKARSFNLLVKSNLGTTDSTFTDENITYLRGETCQGIYLEYKNIRDTMRSKLPFGIAQVGKAFRNELVARQFIFRTREFEQMEMQYFHKPENKTELFEMWKETRMKWLVEKMGLSPDNLRFKKHDKLVFYATAAFDIEYNYKTLGGFKELEGIHDRGDYDLTQHAKFSGEKLDYFDEESKSRMVPHIMETSIGLNRVFMAVLEDAWTEEQLENDTRIVLKLKKSLAPIKVAILPLSKKSELQSKAKEIQSSIRSKFMTQYDETASIGKRYRRQDEIGTPYCVTIDFETQNDGKVTVRDRDSMKQERISISELESYLETNLKD